MKWNEIKRLAIKNGFKFVKSGGRHDEYYNETTGKTIQIERHWSQEVRPGLMKRLKKDIGF
jgi:predicted RNA binding protein YcfA (HicA-like mRNA interferase family)